MTFYQEVVKLSSNMESYASLIVITSGLPAVVLGTTAFRTSEEARFLTSACLVVLVLAGAAAFVLFLTRLLNVLDGGV